ncbi:MAG: TIGR04086 family membrane protein [Sporomusaceae bacterium]|nr:TIGR04086 family membrane protein [Sporomusaceae bacterium]
MYHPSKSKKSAAKLGKMPAFAQALLRGILMSLLVSFTAILIVSLGLLLTDSMFVEQHVSGVMAAITLMSIFLGSLYGAFIKKSKGLLLGIFIGFFYVSISLACGFYLSGDSPSVLLLLNKYAAGLAAGALGGLLGITLS